MGLPCDYYFKGEKLSYNQFKNKLKNLPMSEIEEMFPSIKDEGIKFLSWTTGEQQNERYDLSEQVDDVYTSSYGEEWVNGKYEKRKDVEITLKGEYQLEGEKENYKEVLVTMPKEGKYTEKDLRNGNKLEKTENGNYVIVGVDGAKVQGTIISHSKDEVLSSYFKDKPTQFKSSHWDEPNILVHLRMNTRTDSDGNKVLFIEEVQSDFGQSYKKEQGSKSAIIYDVAKGIYFGKKRGDKTQFEQAVKKAKDNNISEAEVESALNEYGDFTKPRPKEIPEAPFITDTNAWTKLGLKVALKEAVAQGADKIAWTTGEQQNERYDLSKHVDKVYYNPKTKEFGYFIKGEKNPQIHLKTEPNKIADYVGKDIAERLMQEPQKDGMHELNGDGLKVGGSGMKGFYGSPTENKLGIVGKVAKALVKELTGKEGCDLSLGASSDFGFCGSVDSKGSP